MTQQEIVERDVRIVLGDLQLQLIMARAQVQDLQEQLALATPKDGDVLPPKANGSRAPKAEAPQ